MTFENLTYDQLLDIYCDKKTKKKLREAILVEMRKRKAN